MKQTISIFSLCLLAAFLTAPSFSIEVGDKAPAFSGKAQSGEAWDAAEHLGKKNIVVYFYPAAMTGGCTKQACGFRDNKADLDALDAIVVGVSGDKPEGLALFEKANKLNFTLLADYDGALAKAFGVPTRKGGSIEREVDGSTFTLERGVSASRWTFVIGKDGTIIHKSDKVAAAEDSKNVIAALKGK